ncbi:MAG: DUF4153 domain-containing protein [Candidatus Gracilibacteria bacterium]|nr:DUF4153 domain-containing protein [Candidatus Gracilibacteria bacterium]
MVTFLKNIHLNTIIQEIKNTFYRFPLAVIITLILAGLSFYLNHFEVHDDREIIIGKIILTGIITFFLSIGTSLLSENFHKKIFSVFTQIGVIIFGILFYFGFTLYIDNEENIIYFFLTGIGIISFIFTALYVKDFIQNKLDRKVYYNYFISISLVFFFSSIIGVALLVLGFTGIYSIDYLFDLDIIGDGKYHIDWGIIVFILLSPFFALKKLPYKKDISQENINLSFLGFLIRYIAIPFIYIFFIILYLYTVKVLLNFSDWPKGEVSWMVIFFSLFGYIIYIFSYIFEEENNFIKSFRKYFPIVVIPQVFMLFYAIYLRISQYDITLNRYFVVLFGLWLLVISLYSIFYNKKPLLYIPAILSIFTFIISIGPWSVYQLPLERQTTRLENKLIQTNILQNGKIVPLENISDISPENSVEIYDLISYLCRFDNCSIIINLFPEQYEKSLIEYEKVRLENIKQDPENEYYKREGKPSHWNIIETIQTDIKLLSYYTEKSNQFLSFHRQASFYPIDTTNSKKLYSLSSTDLNYGGSGSMYTFYNQEDFITDIDMQPILFELNSLKINEYGNILKEDEGIYYFSNKNGDFTLYINHISIKNQVNFGGDEYFTFDVLLLQK